MKPKFTKFTHKTPHLGKKQHQLDPNLDLKQLVHHATVQYVDRARKEAGDEYVKRFLDVHTQVFSDPECSKDTREV